MCHSRIVFTLAIQLAAQCVALAADAPAPAASTPAAAASAVAKPSDKPNDKSGGKAGDKSGDKTTTTELKWLMDSTKSLLISGDSTGVSLSSLFNCASKDLEYFPLAPMPTQGYSEIEWGENGPKLIHQKWPSGESSAIEVNKLLTEISTAIAQTTTDASANVTLFGGSRAKRKFTIDFMKYRIEPIIDLDNHNLGWGRVGAGMRITIDIEKDDGSVTGSLLALAASAKASKVVGSMTVELVGIDSTAVTGAQPLTIDLSEGNVQRVIEALAVVKAKLYDNTTTLKPRLMARVACGGGTKSAAVR